MSPVSVSERPSEVARLLAEQARELPQKDDLCGPFWGLVALRAAGLGAGGPAAGGSSGQQLDQDAVAVAAGSRLSPPPRSGSGSRPPGEPARDDYRLELPVAVDDPGTSAAGVADAIRELSSGRLAVVPATGDWRTERLLALLESLSALAPPPVAVIANIHTGELWPANVPEQDYQSYLESGRHAGPRSNWSVGHFVALVGLSRGARGTLVEVADTYRSRGVRGCHWQPVERIVAALQGDDKRRGLLLVVAAESELRVRGLVSAAELEARLWDGPRPRRSS